MASNFSGPICKPAFEVLNPIQKTNLIYFWFFFLRPDRFLGKQSIMSTLSPSNSGCLLMVVHPFMHLMKWARVYKSLCWNKFDSPWGATKLFVVPVAVDKNGYSSETGYFVMLVSEAQFKNAAKSLHFQQENMKNGDFMSVAWRSQGRQCCEITFHLPRFQLQKKWTGRFVLTMNSPSQWFHGRVSVECWFEPFTQ